MVAQTFNPNNSAFKSPKSPHMSARLIKMTGGNKKKRKGSASPTRDIAAKRRHDESEYTTNSRTQAHSRAQSFISSDQNRPFAVNDARIHTSLPTNGDWVFRIKVISSTTRPDEEIFREAVQGLVGICFPQGVLEEMGVDVVKQHMLEKGASEESTARMTETFGIEMVDCISQMLTKYLDTPEKIKGAINSVIASSSSLHMDIEDDALGNIAAILARDDSRPGTAVPNDATDKVENDHAPANITTRRKTKTHEKTGRDEVNRRLDEMVVDAEQSTSRTETDKQTSDQEGLATKKKIHASWRWNIDPEGASSEALTEAFQRPADLFAFHALPIVRGMLDADAKRKELRHKMQEMLEDMSADEYEKWIESFQKLRDGDKVMLIRILPESVSINRTAATPAPIDLQRRAGNINTASRGTRYAQMQSHSAMGIEQQSQPIKRENNISSKIQSDDATVSARQVHSDVAATTTALRHLSTEERDMEPAAGSAAAVHQAQCARSGPSGPVSPTPAVDLLWGRAPFSFEGRMNAARVILNNINERIHAPSVSIQLLDGSHMVMSKPTLQSRLVSCVPPSATIGDKLKIRDRMEERLVPWVVADLPAFPELHSEPFVFANLMLSTTYVLDVLFDPDTVLITSNANSDQAKLYAALKLRGVKDKFLRSGHSPYSPSTNISKVLWNPKNPDLVKRGCLERILRGIVFAHREQFPELQSSPLVKTWEHQTGQKW